MTPGQFSHRKFIKTFMITYQMRDKNKMASMMMIILKQFGNLICSNNDFQQLCQLNYEQEENKKIGNYAYTGVRYTVMEGRYLVKI